MKFYFSIIFIVFISCAAQNKEELHGVSNLMLKINMIKINENNKNDITKIFGPPIISDTFDKNLWSYYEVKNETSIFGKKKIILNNLVVFEFNNLGMLIKYKTYDLKDMKNLEFSDKITLTNREDSFAKSFLASTKKRFELATAKTTKKEEE